jgi:hypothetical protein
MIIGLYEIYSIPSFHFIFICHVLDRWHPFASCCCSCVGCNYYMWGVDKIRSRCDYNRWCEWDKIFWNDDLAVHSLGWDDLMNVRKSFIHCNGITSNLPFLIVRWIQSSCEHISWTRKAEDISFILNSTEGQRLMPQQRKKSKSFSVGILKVNRFNTF